MNQADFIKNQNESTKQGTPASVWIIASVIFHVIILLLIMTYKFNIFEQERPQALRPDDQVVLWTSQPQPKQASQPVSVQNEPKPQPKLKQEEKKEVKPEPQPERSQKMPIIVAGKQGIDQQNLDGTQSLVQHPQETTEPITEPIAEPINNITQQQPEQKQLHQEPPPLAQKIPLYTTTPLKLPKGNLFVTAAPKQPTEKSNSKSSLDNQPKESTQMHQHVPKQTKEIPIKTISFKDLGLGGNNAILTFGNSAHMGIQGDSPDIPTGEELKYITYLNQMANMIVSSMHANPHKQLIHRRTYEQVVFHVKVDRAGNLLTTRIIHPSKHEIINIFILESVKQVGLFNPLPNFIKKDTFEINWRISM